MSTSSEFVSLAREWTKLSMHSSMGGFFHHAKKLGLSPIHLAALMKMGKGGANRAAELGGDFGVTSAAVSQMLDRLVELGLVTRTEDPEDRRAKRIALTELGVRTVSQAMKSRRDWIERIVSRMSESEIKAARGAFATLVAKAKEIEEENAGQ